MATIKFGTSGWREIIARDFTFDNVRVATQGIADYLKAELRASNSPLAGRKPVIGRPILYKTTREFLLRFGLKDVTELPSMEEFEKMASLELDEPEPAASVEAPLAMRRLRQRMWRASLWVLG